MSKKQKKRDMHPYPALEKNLNLKTKQDELEIDYIDKLTDKELEWLNRFNEEYVNASLNRKQIKRNIHSTKELKQSCDKKNNDRKTCLFTREKAAGNLRYFSELDYYSVDNNELEQYEDKLINMIENEEEN